MLSGVRDNRWHDIRVASPTITIGSAKVETSSSAVQIQVRRTSRPIIPLTLEIRDQAGIQTALRDIPFEVAKDQKGVVTLSSDNQRTAWRFLIRISAESKKMSLSFTLNYAGLSVDEALRGVTFYGALASGSELRIQGRHPLTGAELHIARATLPAGSYKKPDARFVEILKRLAFIESKTGATFAIPEHDISFEDANTIAATARILETGHGQYTAKPWISVSNVEQARGALESFVGEKPAPMAIHFEGEVVVIFGTHVMLGPVTFFCDRTYITDEDLDDLREQLLNSSPESTIHIRFTPFENCLVEARYINWLPEEEAVAMRELPMYEQREPLIKEHQWSLPPMDLDTAVALLRSWYDEDAEEQREMWESIKVALDEDRLSDRKLFS
jgi:hypothetical protein